MTRVGVLLMSFGAVESPDQLEQYYTNIRGGRRPTAEQLADLRSRYERIGGRSPLLRIARNQARLLQGSLARDGLDVPVYVGMKFWDPFIREALRQATDDGVERLIAFTSGPYDSQVSVASYERALGAAAGELGQGLQVDLVRQWYDRPELEAGWRHRFEEALAARGWDAASTHVIFSAHALPERCLAWHDPYPAQFMDHGRRYAEAWRLSRWGYSYQSAGLTSEPWLGPDILQTLDYLKPRGERRILVVPIGFIADHLEILNDLDLEAAGRASELGLEFQRAASLNEAPELTEMYKAIVRSRLGRTVGLPAATST